MKIHFFKLIYTVFYSAPFVLGSTSIPSLFREHHQKVLSRYNNLHDIFYTKNAILWTIAKTLDRTFLSGDHDLSVLKYNCYLVV